MYNVVKQNYVVRSDEGMRYINSDEVLEHKLASERKNQEAAVLEENAESQNMTEQTTAEQILQAARIQAGLIEGKAKDEADKMLESAKDQVFTLFEEQRQAGYAEGMRQFEEEREQLRRQLEDEYSKKKDELVKEFDARKETLENDIVDVMIQVFDKVFHIQFENKKEILIYLIKNMIDHNENDKNFHVRVSPENKQYLSEHPEIIAQDFSDQIIIDYIADPALDNTECTVETDSGVFDCSIDTEFQNLIRDIKSLC